MIRSNEGKKTFIALLTAIVTFVLLYLVLDLSFILSGLVAILIFVGLVYFIPSKYYDQDGNELTEELIANEMHQTLYRIYESAGADLELIKAKDFADKDVQAAKDRLLETGLTIYEEVGADLDEISRHQFFLEYYIPKARDIILLYSESQKAQGDQYQVLKDNVLKTLDLLQEIFDDELRSFYEDNMKTVHYEKELLQKNVEKIRERNRIQSQSIQANIESIKEEKDLLEQITKDGEYK